MTLFGPSMRESSQQQYTAERRILSALTVNPNVPNEVRNRIYGIFIKHSNAYFAEAQADVGWLKWLLHGKKAVVGDKAPIMAVKTSRRWSLMLDIGRVEVARGVSGLLIRLET